MKMMTMSKMHSWSGRWLIIVVKVAMSGLSRTQNSHTRWPLKKLNVTGDNFKPGF